MRYLSKSKLLNFRQCPKRLWLQTYRPELAEDSQDAQVRFQVGDQVGDIARRLYDPEGIGALVNREGSDFGAAFSRTQALLQDRRPIFEAGFRAEGAQAFADLMLPMKGRGQHWRMVEVKSSASLKDYHRDDAAIQSFVVRAAGVPLTSKLSNMLGTPAAAFGGRLHCCFTIYEIKKPTKRRPGTCQRQSTAA